MIFVEGAAFAQLKPLKNSNLLLSMQPKTAGWKTFFLKNTIAVPPAETPFLSADFYAKQLGFFCRQEIKMDKVTRIPFRFRLGSVEQCDWLEGKRK
jgi:hypothetical protein